MAAIIMLEPFSEAPRKNITVEMRPTPVPSPSQRVKIRVDKVEMTIPRIKIGDLIVKRSVERPIKIFPNIAPKPNKLKMFAETSFEKSKLS